MSNLSTKNKTIKWYGLTIYCNAFHCHIISLSISAVSTESIRETIHTAIEW